jgi:hypothetical protein
MNGQHAARIESFRDAMREICILQQVRAIAEEMSSQVLDENRVAESVAQQLSAELDLPHQFSDPSKEERMALGIRQDNDIKIEGWLNNWTSEKIEAEILASGRIASDRIRERYWLRRIQELNVWPLLFICGADHFTSFATLLREMGMSVIEAYQDWESAK